MSRPARLLAIFAHPDDEAAAAAGTFALVSERRGAVTLVCATRGEVGEISDPALATPETLGSVREGELRSAMAFVGVSDVRFLDFRDSGMRGTEHFVRVQQPWTDPSTDPLLDFVTSAPEG